MEFAPDCEPNDNLTDRRLYEKGPPSGGGSVWSLVIVAAVVVTYLYLDSIVESYAVETQGSKQMNLKDGG